MRLKLKNVSMFLVLGVFLSLILFGNQAAFAAIPSVPTGVTATATSNSITVSWSAVSGATSYDVSANGDVRNTTGTSYTYVAVPGTNYNYAVSAKNSSGSSAYSASKSITTPAIPIPSVPAGVTATATSNSITVSWSAVSGATSYDVSANGDVRNTSATSYTYTAAPGTNYNYAVSAKNSSGASAYSASKSITTPTLIPSVPTGVTATATSNSITVSWSAVSGATSYDVSANGDVRNTTGTSYTYIAVPGTNYNYAVSAKNSSGSSAYSASKSITTPAIPIPSVPAGVTATATCNSVTISWGAVSGATSYDVSANNDVRHVTSGTSFTYTGLPSGTNYSYAVRANNNSGSSAYSSAQSINTLSIPSVPSGVMASADSSSITISWSAVNGATSYDVSANNDVRRVTSGTSSTYTGLPSGTSYSYAVRANSSCGSGIYSTSQSITTIPPTPTGLTAVATTNAIVISWSAARGATGYDISINGDVRTTNSTSYTYTGLSPGAVYSYAVRAKNNSGVSAYSTPPQQITTKSVTTPSVPIGVTATATSNSITISWSAVSGVTSYDVSVNGSVKNTTGTTYTYAGLLPGTSYSYAVSAKNSGGSSAYSSPQSIVTVPSMPANITTTVTNTSIAISWSAVNGATNYDVSINGDVRNTTGTSYTYTNLTPGTTYSCAVRSSNSSGSSVYSVAQSVTLPPPAPTSVTAIAASDSITISWAVANGATSYDVNINGTVKNVVGDTSYTYTGLSPGVTYSYMVRARNGGGVSTYSSSQSIITMPAVPSGVIAIATSNSVTVSWTAVNGAACYDVSLNGDVKNTTSASYTYTGLKPGTTYDYAVRANNNIGSSSYSTPKKITTTAVLSTPLGVAATATTNSITVSWSAVNGATSYEVKIGDNVVNVINTLHTSYGLTPGTTYIYSVRAKDCCTGLGFSEYSLPKTITTIAVPSTKDKLSKGMRMLSQSLDPDKNWSSESGGNYTYIDCFEKHPLLVKGNSDISVRLLRNIFAALGAQTDLPFNAPDYLYSQYDVRLVAAQRAFAEMVGIADAGGMDALTWSKLSEVIQGYGDGQVNFDKGVFAQKFDKHFWLLFLATFGLTPDNSDIKNISGFLREKREITSSSPGTDITYLRMILRGLGLPITDFGSYPNLETQAAIKLVHSQAGLNMDYEITESDWLDKDHGIWRYFELFANMTDEQKAAERKYITSSPSWDKIGKEAAAALDIRIEKNIEADSKGTITIKCSGADSIVFDVINEEGTTVFMSNMGTTDSLTTDNLSFGSGKYSIAAKAGVEVNNKEYKKTSSVGFVIQPINNYQGSTTGTVPNPDVGIGPEKGPTQAMIAVRSYLDTLLSTYHAYEYPDGYKVEDYTWGKAYRERYENEIKFSLNILALQKGIYNIDVLLVETGCVLADIAKNGIEAYQQAVASAGPPTSYPPQLVALGATATGIFIMNFFYDPDPRIFRNLPEALGITKETPPDLLGINGCLNKKIAKALTKFSFIKNSNYNYLVNMGRYFWLFKGPRQVFIDDLDKYKSETSRRTDVSAAYKKELLDYIEVIRSMNVDYDQSLSDMNYFLDRIDKDYN